MWPMINMWQIDVNTTLILICFVISIVLPWSALCACKACATDWHSFTRSYKASSVTCWKIWWFKTGLELCLQCIAICPHVCMTEAGVNSCCIYRVTDTANTRRKMYFSTSFNDIKSTPLHCQIPLALVHCCGALILEFSVSAKLKLFSWVQCHVSCSGWLWKSWCSMRRIPFWQAKCLNW